MSLADVLTKSAARLVTLTPATLTAVYPKPPQAAIPDAQLPAVFQRPMGGEVDYTPSQRIVLHRFDVIALVSRTDDLPGDYDAATALLEGIIGVYESSTTLGVATYYDAQAHDYELGPATYGDAQYLALTVSVTVKEKTAVDLS
jgi:hypothetical protein